MGISQRKLEVHLTGIEPVTFGFVDRMEKSCVASLNAKH
jgi:hypothetical protein